MSAADGVPLTRELLEALVEAAGMQSDMALPNVNLANVWYAVKQKCAAALASGAGTAEGRPVRPHRSGCGHLDCGELQPIPGFAFPPPGIVDAIREFQARDTAAPLDESGAAAPDAELDRLIDEYRTDVINGARMGDLQFWRHADESRAAIHARIEKVKRAAHDIGFRRGLREGWPGTVRPEPVPAPGDASGETDPFRYSENRRIDSNPLTMQCSKLCQLIEEFPASPQQTACIEEANRLLNGLLNQHLETQQLRAATGEVVGQARIVGGKLGVDLIAERVPALLTGEIMQVDLVERRDKEGV